MGIVSVAQCIGVIHLDFSSFSVPTFLLERSALCVAVQALCPWEEEIGLLYHHFVQKENKTE